jgi:hypothetical protein
MANGLALVVTELTPVAVSEAVAELTAGAVAELVEEPVRDWALTGEEPSASTNTLRIDNARNLAASLLIILESTDSFALATKVLLK